MNPLEQTRFYNLYQHYLKLLTLRDETPNTISCYSRFLHQVTLFLNLPPAPRLGVNKWQDQPWVELCKRMRKGEKTSHYKV
jgi:hypothetical protein